MKHMDKDKLCALPKITEKIGYKKVLDVNNSAYVDSFFSYLSSIYITSVVSYIVLTFMALFYLFKMNFN